MAGVLYIVATPIGNLQDISQRARATLQAVDLIAAEDTRRSRQLLNHFDISKKLLSLHEHNESSRSGELIKQLRADRDIALVSDAGTPLISDPGYELVNAARQAGIRVVPIPGPCSIIAALCAAGLPTDRFFYCGFLAAKSKQRGQQLSVLQKLYTTLVILESSHRIKALVGQLTEHFPLRRCVVAKELSKAHEQFLCGSAAQILNRFEAQPDLLKGEFVVLVDNPENDSDKRLNTDDIELIRVLLEEVSVKIAVKIAARLTGKKKNEIYQQALAIQQQEC